MSCLFDSIRVKDIFLFSAMTFRFSLREAMIFYKKKQLALRPQFLDLFTVCTKKMEKVIHWK